jgi:hypothetical protein
MHLELPACLLPAVAPLSLEVIVPEGVGIGAELENNGIALALTVCLNTIDALATNWQVARLLVVRWSLSKGFRVLQ